MNLKVQEKESIDNPIDRFHLINQVCQIIICQILLEENTSLEKGNLEQCTCA